MIVFTKLHLCGDKHLKPCEDILVGVEGCQAVMGLFQSGLLANLIEFRFTDFITDPYALMGLTDALYMNPSLLYVDFSRNNISEDLASAVIQKLYNNPCLSKINLDGNPISTGLFME